MNHTERIAQTASRHRHLTRRLVKAAVEIYLELLREEIARGDWVDIYGIGRIQVNVEAGSGILTPRNTDERTVPHSVTKRLRTKIRLARAFKRQCYERPEDG